jgi:hypothetical protein
MAVDAENELSSIDNIILRWFLFLPISALSPVPQHLEGTQQMSSEWIAYENISHQIINKQSMPSSGVTQHWWYFVHFLFLA